MPSLVSCSRWSAGIDFPTVLPASSKRRRWPHHRGRPVAYGSGLLPEDFARRLHLLKERSGLTWNGVAEVLGVDVKQVLRWREGTEPCGGAMLSLMRLSAQIPGGVDILMGEGFLLLLVRLAFQMPGGLEVLLSQGFQISLKEG